MLKPRRDFSLIYNDDYPIFIEQAGNAPFPKTTFPALFQVHFEFDREIIQKDFLEKFNG